MLLAQGIPEEWFNPVESVPLGCSYSTPVDCVLGVKTQRHRCIAELQPKCREILEVAQVPSEFIAHQEQPYLPCTPG